MAHLEAIYQMLLLNKPFPRDMFWIFPHDEEIRWLIIMRFTTGYNICGELNKSSLTNLSYNEMKRQSKNIWLTNNTQEKKQRNYSSVNESTKIHKSMIWGYNGKRPEYEPKFLRVRPMCAIDIITDRIQLVNFLWKYTKYSYTNEKWYVGKISKYGANEIWTA